MLPVTSLSGTLFQMAGASSPALVTSALGREIGPSQVPDFLQDQSLALEAISRYEAEELNGSLPRALIYGTAGELLAIALENGVHHRTSLECTALLCESVFVQGGLGWPTPIRRIGQAISNRQAPHSLPWAIAALPIGRNIFLNGDSLEGMTSSSRFDQMVLLPGLTTKSLVAEIPGRSSVPNATTYLGGRLWREAQRLLPQVVLHEASHYTNFMVLDSWIEGNQAKPAAERDPAFNRHCRPVEGGRYRLDFSFATLFLELAACLATASFFSTVLKSGGSRDPILQELVTNSIMRGCRYVMDVHYEPYLREAGIPAPDLQDVRSITGTMQRFVSLVPPTSAR